MLGYLRLAAILAIGWALFTLAVQFAFTRAKGFRPLMAKPAADPGRGIRYAMGSGLMPWATESARTHVATYFASMLYHLGILAGLAFLVMHVMHMNLSAGALRLIAALAAIGMLAGFALFLKRALTTALHAMSAPDDYISNALVTAFLGLALGFSLSSIYEPYFFAGSALMLFYLPIGKLRHCLFFFLARMGSGAFFGRRGVLPPPEGRHA